MSVSITQATTPSPREQKKTKPVKNKKLSYNFQEPSEEVKMTDVSVNNNNKLPDPYGIRRKSVSSAFI